MKIVLIKPFKQKINNIFKYLILIYIAAIASCNNPENSISSTPQKPALDFCKCLLEPGNSEYMIQNGQACEEAICIELGVSVADYRKGAYDYQKMSALILTCKMKK